MRAEVSAPVAEAMMMRHPHRLLSVAFEAASRLLRRLHRAGYFSLVPTRRHAFVTGAPRSPKPVRLALPHEADGGALEIVPPSIIGAHASEVADLESDGTDDR